MSEWQYKLILSICYKKWLLPFRQGLDSSTEFWLRESGYNYDIHCLEFWQLVQNFAQPFIKTFHSLTFVLLFINSVRCAKNPSIVMMKLHLRGKPEKHSLRQHA